MTALEGYLLIAVFGLLLVCAGLVIVQRLHADDVRAAQERARRAESRAAAADAAIDDLREELKAVRRRASRAETLLWVSEARASIGGAL